MLNIKQINKIIDNTYDERIAKIFSSKNFEHLLLQQKSVKNKIVIIKKILSKYIIENSLIDKIINDLITTKKLNFIPPGTKSVVKDNYFNWYIKQLLINNLDNQKYFFDFENFSKYTNEKYDFMVINKINNKKIIGMNQLDFWSGGLQVNRAGSYIINYKEEKNVKIISVIANYIQIKSEKSKIFNLFKIGFEKNILTYPKNLINIINDFLN